MIFASMMGFYIGTMSLFLIDLFKFDEKELGLFMLVAGIFLGINQAFLVKRFVNWLGEFSTLLLGLFLSTVGLICITLTSDLYLFFACYYVLNLGLSLCFPTFNALISIHADPKKLGEIMGISESINSFAMAIFPVIGAILYGYIGFEIYYIVSVLPLIALVVAYFGLRKYGAEALG